MEDTILKTVLMLLTALLLMVCLSACANNNTILKGICQGIYNSSNQVSEMKEPKDKLQTEKEPISYDQYIRERQEMLKDQENSQPKQ
jgi:hypothetical protein